MKTCWFSTVCRAKQANSLVRKDGGHCNSLESDRLINHEIIISCSPSDPSPLAEVGNNFEDHLSLIYQAKMSNVHQFQFLNGEDLPLFSVLYPFKCNIFGVLD